MSQLMVVGAGTLGFCAVCAVFRTVERRREMAHYADVYGVFEEIEDDGSQEKEMKRALFEYETASWVHQLFTPPPFRLTEVFDGVDLDLDYPARTELGARFVSLNNLKQ